MFWNKKVRYEKYDKDTERIYAVSENLAKRINNQEAKLDLILDYLELKYVPETKEPAKLVEETPSLGDCLGKMYVSGNDAHRVFGTPSGTSDMHAPPKKRGRPKKK